MSYRVPVDTLSAVAETWQDRRLYLIGGAALAIHGVTRRDTDDLDLAVEVSVTALKGRMASPGWQPVPANEQRWAYSQGGIVDLLPFGEPHRTSGVVRWPTSGQEMNIRGYHLLPETSQPNAVLPANVLLAGRSTLMILKLIAWNDRPLARTKDLGDIGCLLARFLEPDDARRWTGPVLDRDLGYDDASALALGIELGPRFQRAEADGLIRIVERIRGGERGQSWLSYVSRTLPKPMTDDEDAADHLLALFLDGLSAGAPQP